MEILSAYLKQILTIAFYLVVIILAVKFGISFAKKKNSNVEKKD